MPSGPLMLTEDAMDEASVHTFTFRRVRIQRLREGFADPGVPLIVPTT